MGKKTSRSRIKPLVVINIVGLTPAMLGDNTPNLNSLIQDGFMAPLKGVFPALTTTAQASMLTGLSPAEHGIVGNGWYFREQAEVRFWLQSNSLVQGEKVWQKIKKLQPEFRCSKLFWWYNMYSGVTKSITPRPHYTADGRKIMGLYSEPADLHQTIENEIGDFPFFNFWGPAADIRSSRWIVDCALAEYKLNHPHLQLVYLPHLDYNLQRLGPDDPQIASDIKMIDHEAGRLIDFARGQDAEIMVVSEYGISKVKQSIPINRKLREAGLLTIRDSLSWELLDTGASRAFAVSDHQIAHVYIRDPGDIKKVKLLFENVPGISQILDTEGQKLLQINHSRSGELVLISEPECWFNYYYWLNDDKAPDFARTVDIHRKPGYDPVELFIDPEIQFPKLKVAVRMLQKRIGQRMLMDLIPLSPELVKGSHGRLADNPYNGPIFITSSSKIIKELNSKNEKLRMQQISFLIQQHFTT